MFPMNGMGFMGNKDEGLPFIFSVTVGSGESFTLPTFDGGTYDCVIDWGDNNTNTLEVWNASGRSHTYAVGGIYDIRIDGVFDGWSVNGYSGRLNISEIKQWGILRLGSGVNAFRGCSNLLISASDILDTSGCTNFSYFMYGCSSVTTVPNMAFWDVSNVTTMFLAFFGANSFNQDIGNWNMSNVTSMYGMFVSANVFNQDIGDWDVSNVINMYGMFWGAIAFNQDIGDWDVSNVINMYGMFVSAFSFDQNLEGWDVTKVTTMFGMFNGITLSTFNYDSLLVGWELLSVKSNVPFSAGNSKYTSGSAAAIARAALIADHNWTITDGGSI